MSCNKCQPGAPKSPRFRPDHNSGDSDTKVLLADPQIRRRSTTSRTVTLVGNPNVGKSTLFNRLTGAHQAVRNAPGTTVELFEGQWRTAGVRLIDLPGTYSLVPNSPDEAVVSAALSGQQGDDVDLVLVLLDASALKRSLYLLGQVAQTGRPVAAVLTMQDQALLDGREIDADALAAILGIPVIGIDPRRPDATNAVHGLVQNALETRPRVNGILPDPQAPGYNPTDANEAVALLGQVTNCACAEGADDYAHQAAGQLAAEAAGGTAAKVGGADPQRGGASTELERANTIFTWSNRVLDEVGALTQDNAKPSLSDRIDAILLHPILGALIFFSLMWGVFRLMGSDFVARLQEIFEFVFDGSPDAINFSLAQGVTKILGFMGMNDTWLESLINDGILTGIGVAASFVPLMFIMFIAIATLEDSGYMARAAFLGDRLMRMVGLDGRVIMPLVVGFGCNLPALAAIRTLPNAKQRLVTTMIIPWASCSARVTIYILIARIFFGANSGNVVFAMYVISLVLMVIGGLVLKPFITRSEAQAPLMLVLPPYQLPRIFVMLRSAAMRSWAFITGAGKIIVIMTVVIWAMMATPISQPSAAELAENRQAVAASEERIAALEAKVADSNGETKEQAEAELAAAQEEQPVQLEEHYKFGNPGMPQEHSLYGKLAGGLAPVFAPAGFNDWHLAGALMTGFVAKETVISSIVASYNMSEDAVGDAEDDGTPTAFLTRQIGETFRATTGADSPTAPLAQLAAFGFLVFVLAYTPCLATVAEQVRQVGAKWAIGGVVVQLLVAWVAAVAIFQIGRLFLA